MDGVLIANELIDSIRRQRMEGVIFKIDQEKACDHVEWEFVDYIMQRFGFGNIWRSWVLECMSFSIIVNYALFRLFKASKRIWQVVLCPHFY